jgi:hypothetical protein
MYELKNLIEIFELHSDSFKSQHQQYVENWKAQNPDQEIPEDFKNPFNISEALGCMCKIMNELKEKSN